MSKIFNSKSLAIALSVVMVVCAFCATLSVSADDANLLAGLSYTYTMNAFWAGGEDTNGTILTDGAYRGDGTNAYNGSSAVTGVSAELAGTYAENKVEFAFDDATSIGTIVIRNARTFFQNNGVNRHLNVANVEVTSDGLNYTAATFTAEYVAVADAPLYAVEQGGEEFPQYFDIVVDVTGADDALGLRVTMTTERADASYAYIVQLDEIEAYAPGVEAPVRGEAGDDSSVEDSSVEDSSVEDSSVEDSSVEDSSVEDSSVEDSSVVEIPVAGTTFKVLVKENGDGTVTITATVPADIDSGKIVVSVSDDLTIVPGSLAASVAGSTLNENYTKGDVSGATNAFAGTTANPEGTVAFTANYTLAEGATLDTSDVTVPEWNLSTNSVKVGTQKDGNVDMTFDFYEESSVEDSSVEDSSVVDSSVVDSSVEDSSTGDNNTSGTGDAGIAVFAVLAVLSGAAVVVLKKKA